MADILDYRQTSFSIIAVYISLLQLGFFCVAVGVIYKANLQRILWVLSSDHSTVIRGNPIKTANLSSCIIISLIDHPL